MASGGRAADMRLFKLVACFLLATLVVLAMLIAGLEAFYRDPPASSAGLETFEIEYLTPEEAAELLGDDVARYRTPRMIVAPPPPPERSPAPD